MQTLFPTHPHYALKATIIVPVKNEEVNLYGMLDALRLQVDAAGNEICNDLYEVLLLANNCTDHSFPLAAAYKLMHPGFNLQVAEIRLDKEQAHIGTVRRLLMDEAYQRFQLLGRPEELLYPQMEIQG
ncbi:hypothetical protein [Pedobacter hartonius]|nr:hypothetical protein [Pedobacter hartonius]